ncbi:MAG TPA: DUF4492 domain-containing protein [Bacteroidales bacterium]|jgi:hypothetical protein|nr:DUF4492 domain-containing protein [Bacteroidales bacterium]HRW21519.1 DUF4492 domain-containing protein [Bacteroidales bacterium]HXK82590.1 DUF4492 domain-containing protein [Bacteroidales bacterium]
MIKALKKVFKFYYEGFRDMPRWGKTLWTIIILKGLLVFVLVKFIFFPNYLKTNFDSDSERSEYVLDQLTKFSEYDDTIKH